MTPNMTYGSPMPAASVKVAYTGTAGTTSATTFKIRCGGNGVTIYVNGNSSGSRMFGGVASARLRVTEIRV